MSENFICVEICVFSSPEFICVFWKFAHQHLETHPEQYLCTSKQAQVTAFLNFYEIFMSFYNQSN